MAVAAVLSAGLGLTAVMPAPAFAAAPVAAVVVPPPDTGPPPVVSAPADRSKKLAGALITVQDLPGGYQKQDDAYLGEMFRAMLGRHAPDADPCAVPAKPAKSATPPVTAGEPAPSAATLFFNEDKEFVAVETLAAVGAETAAGMVADLSEVLKKCPAAESGGVTLTMRALDWDPPLGDRSRTVGMVMDMQIEGVRVTMQGKLAQVAYRDVSLVVGLIGPTEPKDRHLKKIASAAVRRLVTSTDVFTTERTGKP